MYSPGNGDTPDAALASLTDLVGHIIQHYHEKLRADLPRLTTMGEEVIAAHAERHPEVRDVAAVLAALRAELESHTPPSDACQTFRAYYEGLATLERELHDHIHLENNVLFPRAQTMEAEVLGRP
jgi:regulator of cell morphogenesis and NO signaling